MPAVVLTGAAAFHGGIDLQQREVVGKRRSLTPLIFCTEPSV
jgi:hypothetical protein